MKCPVCNFPMKEWPNPDYKLVCTNSACRAGLTAKQVEKLKQKNAQTPN